jgi:hypothetical protein
MLNVPTTWGTADSIPSGMPDRVLLQNSHTLTNRHLIIPSNIDTGISQYRGKHSGLLYKSHLLTYHQLFLGLTSVLAPDCQVGDQLCTTSRLLGTFRSTATKEVASSHFSFSDYLSREGEAGG